MKKVIIFICLIVLISVTTGYPLEVGEKVYKEIILGNQRVNKWVNIFSITDYDDNCNEIHYKNAYDEEWWYEYDAKGNRIYGKNSYGEDEWHKYEYDDKGNIIHVKDSDGNEHWYEYNTNGELIYEKNLDGKEFLYYYDAKGNIIREKERGKGLSGFNNIYVLDYSENEIIKRKTEYNSAFFSSSIVLGPGVILNDYSYDENFSFSVLSQINIGKIIINNYPENIITEEVLVELFACIKTEYKENFKDIRYDVDANKILINYPEEWCENEIIRLETTILKFFTIKFEDIWSITEYDSIGNKIHYLGPWVEEWYEYDDNGNKIYELLSGERHWFGYEYGEDRKIKKKIEYSLF